MAEFKGSRKDDRSLFDNTPPRFGKRPIVVMVQDGTEINIALKKSYQRPLRVAPQLLNLKGSKMIPLHFEWFLVLRSEVKQKTSRQDPPLTIPQSLG